MTLPRMLDRIRSSIPGRPTVSGKGGRGTSSILNTLVFHFRPRTVREETLTFSLTWGLGGMAAVLVLFQFGSGILLKFAYEPTVTGAYPSIVALQQEVLFGRLVRNIHHWSANLLVVVVCGHLLRVFFTGAFHPPRQLNWVVGLGLLGTVLLANFSGYLLPWDQLAYWAVTICTGMLEYVPGIGLGLQSFVRGGSEIGPSALQLFYTTHTALIPLALAILMGFHFWRIRKAKGLVIPRPPGQTSAPDSKPVPAWPNLLVREAAVGMALCALIFMLAAGFDAPLGEPANPGLSPNPTKAPWYFAGLQELLIHFHPLFAVLVIPALVLIALLLVPYFWYQTNTAGVWFASPTGRLTALMAFLSGLVLTPALIVTDEFFVDAGAWMPAVPAVVSTGVIPAAILVAALCFFYWLVRIKFSGTRNDALQAVFVLLATAFFAMTVICVWFRGAGMKLAWP